MNTIHDLIGAELVRLLQDACTDTIPDSEYRATEIRQGLLQADPVRRRISLLVNIGDPEDTGTDPKWSDGPADTDSEWKLPGYEIGGGGFWWRKYTIEVNVYLVRTAENRGDARSIGTFVFERARKAIDMKPIIALSDNGEAAQYAHVKRTVMRESGGPPSSFIWTGKLYVQVLTEVSV